MKKPLFSKLFSLALLVLFFAANAFAQEPNNKAIAQQNVLSTDHKVNFKLQITEIENPDSVAINWFVLPYVPDKTVIQQSLFTKKTDPNGLYEQTITFPDSVMGKSLAYSYAAAQDKSDIWRLFTLEKNKVQDRIESWGFIDGLEGKVRPTQMLFPVPDSRAC